MINEKYVKTILFDNFKNNKSILCGFAYGSAALKQNNNKPKMLDLILIVNNIYNFHSFNLNQNYKHYSFLCRLLGPKGVAYLNSLEPFILFNHSVNMVFNNETSQLVKYGVISKDSILYQLNNYNSLYTLGRMQKPIIMADNNKLIVDIISHNKKIALFLSILISKDTKNFKEVLHNIISLSYLGDIRFYLKGEKSTKINDILYGSYNNIYNEYISLYNNLNELNININEFKCNIKINSCKLAILNNLPNKLLLNIQKKTNFKCLSLKDFKKIMYHFDDEFLIDIVRNFLTKMNFNSSLKALFINFITSPVIKGTNYVIAKLKKGILNNI